MFGTLYEPPSLTFSGLFILFAIQVAGIFFYKQAVAYYRNQQLYPQYHQKNGVQLPPGVPAGPATATR